MRWTEEPGDDLEAQISLKYFDLEGKYTEIGEIYRDIARLRMRRHTQTLSE